VYRPPEIGYDTPPPSQDPVRPARPGKLARRLILALIVGFFAGAAIMLQVKGWGAVIGEAGGACGSSRGVSYGACPRGTTPALIISFLVGFPSVPAAIALLFMKGWARRALVAVGLAGGLFAGQSLFGIWHGSDLTIAWAAPHDGSSQLTTVGAWASGDALIRVRNDEVISYDAATGASRWTLTVPGIYVACSMSGTSSSGAIGLIGYGQGSTTCDHMMAVDLATGRMLWSESVQHPYTGATGGLAVAGDTAVVLTDEGITGVSAASGAGKWTLTAPSACVFEQLAASGGNLIALAACQGAFVIVSIDPATGKAAWQYRVTEPADAFQFQILSASPVVISDDLVGPRGTSTVRVLGQDGTVTSTFSVSGIPLGGGTVALDTASHEGFAAPVIVADGMLAGVTTLNGPGDAIVGYRLADGKRQWLIHTPDEVHDVALRGSDLLYADESDPAYSLEEVNLATGTLRSDGYFTQSIVQPDEYGLYAFSGYLLVVNTLGSSFSWPPVAAIKASAVAG
jgi:outer membrane protein assembly factor BamB